MDVRKRGLEMSQKKLLMSKATNKKLSLAQPGWTYTIPDHFRLCRVVDRIYYHFGQLHQTKIFQTNYNSWFMPDSGNLVLLTFRKKYINQNIYDILKWTTGRNGWPSLPVSGFGYMGKSKTFLQQNQEKIMHKKVRHSVNLKEVNVWWKREAFCVPFYGPKSALIVVSSPISRAPLGLLRISR